MDSKGQSIKMGKTLMLQLCKVRLATHPLPLPTLIILAMGICLMRESVMMSMGMKRFLHLRGFSIFILIFRLMKMLCKDQINHNKTQILNLLNSNSRINNNSLMAKDNPNSIIKIFLGKTLTIFSKAYLVVMQDSQSFTSRSRL